jgi:signal transduction histidine kinase
MMAPTERSQVALSVPVRVMATVPQRRLLGLAVWTVAWAFAAAAAVLALVAQPFGNDLPFEIHREFFVPDLVVGVLHAPVSALVLTRSRHPLGWLLAATAVGFAMTSFALAYTLVGHDRPGLPMLGPVSHFVTWGWALGAFAMALVMPWLLTQRTPTGWRLAAAWTGLALTLAACLPRAFLQIPGAPDNPMALQGRAAAWAEGTLGKVLVPLGVGYALCGVGFLLWRRAKASAEERRGLGWVIASLVLVTTSYAVFEVGLRADAPLLGLGAAGIFAAEVMLPAAVLVLVLRQQLWGLDVAVSRATVWGLLSALLVGTYVALVWLGGRLLSFDREASAFVAAAVLALAMQPIRQWMQERVDRLVYGTGADVGRLLAKLGDAARSESLDGMVEGLRRDLRLRYVAVRSVPGLPPVRAVAGSTDRIDVHVPLTNQGRTVGELLVAARAGERLDPRTHELLDQVAGLVAVAVELTQSNQRLATARDRALEVRHEERRLLRRELHDSLGPALAGIGLGLAAIGNDAGRLSARNATLLVQLQQELTRRSDDVRTMAHALLPPALDDGRLEEALATLGRRFTDTGFTVEVDASGADEIDTRRQVAVYHVAGEALLNARRHSGAAHCLIRVRLDETGAVVLTVQDDGRGLDLSAAPGVGLQSMRERVDEASGELLIHDDQGTRIEVRLP